MFAPWNGLCLFRPVHGILELEDMGRNLYILAATLGAIAAVSLVLSFTNVAQQPGSPGDASLWRMTAIAFFALGLIVTLAGVLSSLFEQAERRHERERLERRRRSD